MQIDTNAYEPVRSEHRAEVTAGRRAFSAILLQAVNDIRTLRIATRSHGKRVVETQAAFIEAWLWLADNRDDYPTSFKRVCDGLNMDHHRIRKQLGIDPNDNFFGWKKLSPRNIQE